MTAERWEDYFQPGEKLLWQGAPMPGFHAPGAVIFMSIFGIPFLVAGLALGFGGLWAIFIAESWGERGLALLATVFGLPFLGIGLYLVIGQWWIVIAAPRRIRYALSTRAAYIARNFWRRQMTVYPISADTPLELVKGRLGDTLWFHSYTEKDSDGPVTTRAGFENIAEGRQVLRLMRELKVQK